LWSRPRPKLGCGTKERRKKKDCERNNIVHHSPGDSEGSLLEQAVTTPKFDLQHRSLECDRYINQLWSNDTPPPEWSHTKPTHKNHLFRSKIMSPIFTLRDTLGNSLQVLYFGKRMAQDTNPVL